MLIMAIGIELNVVTSPRPPSARMVQLASGIELILLAFNTIQITTYIHLTP